MLYIDETVAAEQLGLQVKTLRNWRLRGVGPGFYKFGAAVRYNTAELKAWAEEQRRQSTTTASAGEAR